MVQCECGKTLDKVPSWLGTVKVSIVCNNCPNRTVKSIAEAKVVSTVDSRTTIGDEKQPEEETEEETEE
jgi:hypothetical protein